MYALFICFGNTGKSNRHDPKTVSDLYRTMFELRRETAHVVPKTQRERTKARVHASTHCAFFFFFGSSFYRPG
jgi:hypothetical protein